jgi:signal transduction histidine kinase/ActR/RegA family two-component response regulator
MTTPDSNNERGATPVFVAEPNAHYEFVAFPGQEIELRVVSSDLLMMFGAEFPETEPGVDGNMPPEFLNLVRDLAGATTQDLRPLKHEFRVALAAGEIRWIRTESFPHAGKNGEISWQGHATDITAQKEKEEELREEIELMEFCHRVARMGYWVLDLTTRKLDCSQGLLLLLGFDESLDLDLDDLLSHFADESRELFREAIDVAGDTRKGWDLVLTMNTKTEGALRVRSVGAQLRQGRFPRVCCVIHDITSQAAQMEADERSGRIELLGQLAGGIAHDFNNLLTAISLSLDSIKADVGISDRVRTAVRDAENATRSSQRLTHQLLTFAKGGAPVKVVSDLKRLLGETLDFTMSGSGCRCIREIGNDLWPVNIDRAQIQQVIQNLVINAREATSDRGEIHVTLRNVALTSSTPALAAGSYCELVICDNGPGIPEHARERLFSPYFTTKPHGTGLGLATSFSIAKRHEGWLACDASPEQGAVFRLMLPAERKRGVVETRRIAYVRRGRGRILLMDDQLDILRILSAALERFGYQVTAVPDSDGALDAVRKARDEDKMFAVAVLDLTLPGGRDGVETLRLIRETEPGLPAVGCSGYAESDVMAHPQRYGFQRMLAKPFRVDELVEVLQAVAVAD